MTTCARCGRNVTAPMFAGGMAFGFRCFRKVAGATQRRAQQKQSARRARKAAKPAPDQLDFFAEDLNYAQRVDALLSNISLEMQ